jgi:hypothetical protein
VDEEFQVGQRAREGDLRVLAKHNANITSEGESVRLHELMVGPGIFHVLVFTSDMVITSSDKKGTKTAHAVELAKEIKTHLQSWRSRWAYKPAIEIGKPGAILNSSSIPATRTLVNASPAAIPHTNRAELLFMVHVLASAPSLSPSSSSHLDTDNLPVVEAGVDILAGNKAGEGKIYLDPQGIVHQRYGVSVKNSPGAIVVVRPDSHLGYRVLGINDSAWNEVNSYFESILIK